MEGSTLRLSSRTWAGIVGVLVLDVDDAGLEKQLPIFAAYDDAVLLG